MPRAYLALGSNLGDRLALLRAAVAGLAGGGRVQVTRRSPIYKTDAVAREPQPPYLNAVVEVETALAPRALLELCLEIERSLGRVRPPTGDKAARTIDIDILLYGHEVVNEPSLHIPHREILVRPFVRIPLAAVAAPGLRHPVSGDALDTFASEPHPGVRLYEASL